MSLPFESFCFHLNAGNNTTSLAEIKKLFNCVLNGHISLCCLGLDSDDFVCAGWGMCRDVCGSDPLPSGHH